MSGIVLELQRETLDPSVNVTDLARKAKLIAVKLEQRSAIEWITRELEGYAGSTLKDFPKYRIVSGTPQALNPYHGWQAIYFHDKKTYNAFSSLPVAESLAALEDLIKNTNSTNETAYRYPHYLQEALMEAIGMQTQVRLLIGRSSLVHILDKVRNLILDWSAELETQGIRGENLQFTAIQKKEASQVTQNFFTQNANIIGSMADQSSVVVNQTGTFNIDAARSFVAQAKELSALLPDEKKDDVIKALSEAEDELKAASPDQGKIKSALEFVKDSCSGMTGNLAASGIVEGLTQIFG